MTAAGVGDLTARHGGTAGDGFGDQAKKKAKSRSSLRNKIGSFLNFLRHKPVVNESTTVFAADSTESSPVSSKRNPRHRTYDSSDSCSRESSMSIEITNAFHAHFTSNATTTCVDDCISPFIGSRASSYPNSSLSTQSPPPSWNNEASFRSIDHGDPSVPLTYGAAATERLENWLSKKNLCIADIMKPVEEMSDTAKDFWRGFSRNVDQLVWPFHAKQVSRFTHMDRKNPGTGENFSLGESAYDYERKCFKPEAYKGLHIDSSSSSSEGFDLEYTLALDLP